MPAGERWTYRSTLQVCLDNCYNYTPPYQNQDFSNSGIIRTKSGPNPIDSGLSEVLDKLNGIPRSRGVRIWRLNGLSLTPFFFLFTHSAGVGRSGTYIGLDFLIHQVKDLKKIDVASMVIEMRRQRTEMIQSLVSEKKNLDW